VYFKVVFHFYTSVLLFAVVAPPPIALYTIRGEIVLYWLIFLSINLEGVVECKRRKLTIEIAVVSRIFAKRIG